jgi:hypothetical protein
MRQAWMPHYLLHTRHLPLHSPAAFTAAHFLIKQVIIGAKLQHT